MGTGDRLRFALRSRLKIPARSSRSTTPDQVEAEASTTMNAHSQASPQAVQITPSSDFYTNPQLGSAYDNSDTSSPPANANENAALRTAIDAYLARLPDASKEAFRQAATRITEKNLMETIDSYDQDHKRRSAFRPRAPMVAKFLGLLDRFMGGVAIGIQCHPEISSLVVGGVRLILDIAIKFVTFFESLSEMLCRFGQYIEVLSEYSKAADISLMRTSIAYVYEDLLEFCFEARSVFVDGRGQPRRWESIRVFVRTQWEPFQERFGKIQEHLDNHLNLLGLSTGAAQLNILRDVSRKAEADRYRKGKEHLLKERKALLKWLSKLDFEATHNNIHAKRHPGTGDWLIENESFRRWFLGDTSRLLWCHGKAGVGKSVLCSHLLEHITSAHEIHSDVGIVFAYCKWDQPETQKPAQIVAAFIKELCWNEDPIPQHLLDLFHSWTKNNRELSSAWDKYQYTELFVTLGRKYNELFLVMDALDECSEENRGEIMNFLLEVCSSLPCVKILITSRLEKDIATVFEGSNVPTIKIETANVSADIRRYAADQTQQLILERRLVIQDEDLKDTIIDVLSECAEGMFLWVNIQLARLCQATKDRHIKDMLKTLPRGLNATYSRMMAHIEQQEQHTKELALKCLTWVLYAKTPLTPDELRHAVCVDNSIKSIIQLDPESTKNILSACANILVEERGHICLIHFSAQEFLTKSPKNVEGGLLSVMPSHDLAQCILAKACISYICLSIRESDPWNSYWTLQDFWHKYPFAWYAAHFFDQHVSSITDIPEDLLGALDQIFSQESTTVRAILQFRALYSRSLPRAGDYGHAKTAPSSSQKSLFISTSLSTVQILSQRYPSFELSLHEVTASGDINATKWLISKGQDVNQRDDSGRTPLFIAARAGYNDVCDTLLSSNALVLTNGTDEDNAFHTAARRNDIPLMKVLLRHSNSVNIRGGFLGTPLQAACYHEDTEMVKLLLQSNADVNAQGGHFGSALNAAAYYGRKETLRVLLSFGADVNQIGGLWKTALEVAASRARFVKTNTPNDLDVDSESDFDDYENVDVPMLASQDGGFDAVISEELKTMRAEVEEEKHDPRHYADVMWILLQHNPDNRSRHGAARSARKIGGTNTAQILLKYSMKAVHVSSPNNALVN